MEEGDKVCCGSSHRKTVRVGVSVVGSKFADTPLAPYVGKYLCNNCRNKILASKQDDARDQGESSGCNLPTTGSTSGNTEDSAVGTAEEVSGSLSSMATDIVPPGADFDRTAVIPYCCDPFHIHFKVVTADVRHPSDVLCAMALKMSKKVLLSAEDYLCRQCRQVISESEVQASQESGASAQSQGNTSEQSQDSILSPGLSPSVLQEQAKTYIATVSGSAISLIDYKESGKFNYAKRKLEEIDCIVKKKLCVALDMPDNTLDKVGDENTVAQDLHDILIAVRDKLPSLPYANKIQLLTVCPPSWSERETAEFFKVSRYAVRKAKTLCETEGVFAKPRPNIGRPIPEETKKLVHEFYCSDDVSRVMPGRRDSVSMGGGVQAQKRLLLGNLRELYKVFKDENPSVKLGFSLFAALRPKFCVIAGASGTHTVCLCTTHQNLKLKFHALKINEKIRDVIPQIVCADHTRECMLRICKKCPNEEDVVDVLKRIVQRGWDTFLGPRTAEEVDSTLMDILKETVQYSEWTTVDIAEIIALKCTVQELLCIVARDLQKAIPHDFIAGEQAKFLKNKKENIKENEAVIVMDFSMNYSCLLQDAIQNYHWSKKQTTVHPVVIHHNNNGVPTHTSLCFISDDLDHDSTLVQMMQDATMQYISEALPFVKKVTYMTDGCGQQYKNYRSFIYLCRHLKNHGIEASWCFFATSHGKSTCDAVGAIVKRGALKASLQRPKHEQIVDAHKLYDFCKESVLSNSVKFFFLSKGEVDARRTTDRDVVALPIPGTRSFHHFFPMSETSVGCKRVSSDQGYSLVHEICESSEPQIWEENMYVAVMVEKKNYVALITDVDNEEQEADLMLLHPPLPSSVFTWSEDTESYVAPFPHILGQVPIQETDDNRYILPVSEILKIRSLAALRKLQFEKQNK